MEYINEVAEYDPLRRVYTERFIKGLFPVAGRWSVVPHENGCTVSLEVVEWRPTGINKLIEALIVRNFSRTQQTSFNNLKRLMETRHSAASPS